MNSDPIVMEYYPHPLGFEQSDRLAEKIKTHLSEKGYGLWAVETKSDGQFIGYIGFSTADFISNFTPCTEIGWRLRKEAWGNGYATEGAKACLEYGFTKLGFKEIFSFTSLFNKRSEKVMIKIGMEKIREFDHPNVEDGDRLKRHVLYKITQEEHFSPSSRHL